MENVTDALYLSFAVLLLVLALAGSIYIFSLARQTSDNVISTVESSENDDWFEKIDLASALSYREVGMETIIPSLYRYYKENLTIVFLQGTVDRDGDDVITGLTVSGPLPIYHSETDSSDWTTFYKGDGGSKYPCYGYELNDTTNGNICVFDIEEENGRVEPFAADRKKNIDDILNGNNPIYIYRGEEKTYTYSGNPLAMDIANNYSYLELVFRESKENLQADANKTTRKTVITYVRIPRAT